MSPSLKRSIPAVGASGARYRPFLHSTAEPARSLARSGGQCHIHAVARARRELSVPSGRAFPGGLQISAPLYSFLWTWQRKYAYSVGLSIGRRQSTVVSGGNIFPHLHFG